MERISRRVFLETGAAAAAGGFVVGGEASRAAGARPNLLFVFPDQFRVFALGFMNADPVRTPRLDAFAGESAVVEHAVSNFPICSPYRAMLFTGQWPYANGVFSNCNSSQPDIFLQPSARCFSDVLAESGYETGYIGKYHLDVPGEEDARYGEGPRGGGTVWDAYTPPGPRRHGFRFWHSYGCCDRHLNPHYWHGDAPVSEPTRVEGWSVRHEADVAAAFIRNEGAKQRDPHRPFALFIAHNPPHPPYSQVPADLRTPYADVATGDLLVRPNLDAGGRGRTATGAVADYFAAVSGVDAEFGRLLDTLAETGLADNTIVVFTSDHGEMMGSHARMGKGTILEEAFRIPFLVRYPNRVPPARVPLHLNVPDVMPTLLGLMGLGARTPASVQGHDRSGILTGASREFPDSSFYVMGPKDPDRGSRGVRTDRYTFAVTKGGPDGVRAVLYDRQSDPYQQQDMAAAQPEVCRTLAGLLNRWLAETGDPWQPLTWPPVLPESSFVVVRAGAGARVDFEPGARDGEPAGPASAWGALTSDPGEIIAGARSFKLDSMGSKGVFHECLRLQGLLAAGATYEIRFRYRVLASDEETRFYNVVRSDSDIDRKAARIYWVEPPGEVGERSFTCSTGNVGDHHILFGVQHRGAIVLDDIEIMRTDGEAQARP